MGKFLATVTPAAEFRQSELKIKFQYIEKTLSQ